MNSSKLKLSAMALAFALVIALPATPAFAAQESVEAALLRHDIQVSRLQVIEAEGILILRGQISQAGAAAQIEGIVRGLGYNRVANLVEVVAVPDDEAIVLNVERELGLTRSLEGCRFVLAAKDGVVTVRGTVRSVLQKDLAEQVIRRVSGVRTVVAALDTV